jgi:hypothetical protein
MIDERNTEAISFLEQLNAQIGEAELGRDEAFLRSVLADELVFRRASGKVITKEEYLTELMKPENTYDYLISENTKAVINDETSLVSLRVRAKGKRGETGFEGVFHNLRVFVRREDEWQCLVWFNRRIS